jgi:flagellar protein FlaJ
MNQDTIPFAPFQVTRSSKRMLQGFYPIGAALKSFFPRLKTELSDNGSHLTSTEYLSGVVLTSVFYFALSFILLLAAAEKFSSDVNSARVAALAFAGFLAIATFGYSLLFPRLLAMRFARDIDRNLLFATRHLTIQTSAGVPLFESIVSISENYGDPLLDYGTISAEFARIVKEVHGGKELTTALEDLASRVSSDDYRRLVWQIANANKAGANMGFVLRQMMSYIADEQRVKIRDYGSQLSPLAIFYMLMCIIAPTMGVIFLIIISTLAHIQITDAILGGVLVFSLIAQVVFIGLIKSRRPVVAL